MPARRRCGRAGKGASTRMASPPLPLLAKIDRSGGAFLAAARTVRASAGARREGSPATFRGGHGAAPASPKLVCPQARPPRPRGAARAEIPPRGYPVVTRSGLRKGPISLRS